MQVGWRRPRFPGRANVPSIWGSKAGKQAADPVSAWEWNLSVTVRQLSQFFLASRITRQELVTIPAREDSMKKPKFAVWRIAFPLLILILPATAQTYTDLYDLTQTTGSGPGSPDIIAQGRDGSLYSTMSSSYPGDGTALVTPPTGGTASVIHYFNGTDGYAPASGLTLGMDGNFYGTTYIHTTGPYGEVFQITPDGAVKVLYGFSNGTDGAYPWAPPIMAADGNLYGVTQGGTPVAYKIAMPAGTFSVLANLPAASIAPLIVGSDNNFYGVTLHGGTYNQGTVFQLTKKGVLTLIHSFDSVANDGESPTGPVLQGTDGKLYGTTAWGGTTGNGTVFSLTTTGGSYKVMHSFNSTDGSRADGGMVQGNDGYLYGATVYGGANGGGVFFKISTGGTKYTILHEFDGKPSGGNPFSTPMLHTDGLIYGWAGVGPKEGALYSMDVGLAPFVAPVVLPGAKIGTPVGIIGQGFNSATAVKFGNVKGTFTVVSDTFMVATPTGSATTDKITVFEPSGNLTTLKKFKITPSLSSFSPTSGAVGTSVTINGASLSQTTAVKFGSVAATFVVNSNTKLTATVPAGAATGKITVTTQGGTVSTTANFTVN